MKKAMALLLACSMVLAFAACSKKQYTEQEVTAVVDVTDENGKTVTDKDGKAQTRVVTIPQTDAKGNTVAAGRALPTANPPVTAVRLQKTARPAPPPSPARTRRKRPPRRTKLPRKRPQPPWPPIEKFKFPFLCLPAQIPARTSCALPLTASRWTRRK